MGEKGMGMHGIAKRVGFTRPSRPGEPSRPFGCGRRLRHSPPLHGVVTVLFADSDAVWALVGVG